jgi:hypothetical protein
VTDSAVNLILLLGENGFSGKCIARRLSRRGSPCSLSTVYRVLARNKVSLWDYRHGETKHAKQVLHRLIFPSLSESPRRKEKTA